MMKAAKWLLPFLTLSSPGYSASQWRLVWNDEFGGHRIDTTKWRFATDCWGGGNNERQCYTDSGRNASVHGGRLTITARREDAEGAALPEGQRTAGEPIARKKQSYTSAKLTTAGKAAWRYGRVEVRARLPLGQGTWPAIWMMSAEQAYGAWAASGEIDILETVNLGAPCAECPSGKDDRVLGTLHFGGVQPRNQHKGDELFYPPILDRRFHLFGLIWSPTQMTWTIDGKPYAVRNQSEWYSENSKVPGVPFDRPFYLIINLAVGGGLAESRDLKTVDPRAFPARFELDYVRVWQLSDQAGDR